MPRILVVDDSESVLAYLESILRKISHEVFAASSGTQALQILERESVDLAIIDIYMPAPDGLEVMRRSREMKLDVPFIAISAQPSPSNKFGPARAFGAQIALQKPFSRERLIEAVEAILDVHLGSSIPQRPRKRSARP